MAVQGYIALSSNLKSYRQLLLIIMYSKCVFSSYYNVHIYLNSRFKGNNNLLPPQKSYSKIRTNWTLFQMAFLSLWKCKQIIQGIVIAPMNLNSVHNVWNLKNVIWEIFHFFSLVFKKYKLIRKVCKVKYCVLVII